MRIQLDQRNKKAMRFGIIGIGIILLLSLFLSWLQSWASLRQSIAQSNNQLAILAGGDEKLKSLRVKVPAVEVPQKEQKQLFAFRDELNTQLKRAGIQVKPFKVTFAAKSAGKEYQYMYVQCSGKATFESVLNFLADLKRNPYLVGIEELGITKTDARNAQSREVNLELKVSTFVKR
jgi:hypothetical protein